MPLFFMISGFFIKFNLNFSECIKKEFKRLMVPYFLFANIGLVMSVMKHYALHREELNYLYELKGIFIWMDMLSLKETYAFVLWFLPALFFARVLLIIIYKYVQSLFFQFILVSFLFVFSFYIKLPFGIDKAMNAILFVFLGNLFFRFLKDSKEIYIFPLIFFVIFIFFGTPPLNMATKYYSNIILNVIFAVSIVVSLVVIFKNAKLNLKILTLWGSNTMLLFILHPYTNNIADTIVEKLHFGDYWFFKLFISLILLQVILSIKIRYGKLFLNYA